MDHRQHQCDVGAGAWLDELVGRLGGGRPQRVDHDDLRPVGAGGLDGRPQVTVGQPGVAGPDDDQAAVAQLERVEPEAGAVGHPHAGADGRAANRPIEQAGAEVVEEPAVHAGHGEQALVAGIAERKDRFGAVLVDHAVQAGGDLGQRVVPRDLLEPALALRADPAQRVEEAVGAVHAVDEAVDLGAQLAVAVRVVGPAADLDGDAVAHGHVPAAGVGAVVVARAVHDLVDRHPRDATHPPHPRVCCIRGPPRGFPSQTLGCAQTLGWAGRRTIRGRGVAQLGTQPGLVAGRGRPPAIGGRGGRGGRRRAR